MNASKKPMPAASGPTLGSAAADGRNVAFSAKSRLLKLAAFSGVLLFAFLATLVEYFRFSFREERNSYLILIPFISAYLIWTKRNEISRDFKSSPGLALAPMAIGVVALVATFLVAGHASKYYSDRLTLQVISLLSFLVGGSFIFIGARTMRQIAFPICFLAFAIPMPEIFAEAIEVFLQVCSAEATSWMLALTNITVFRDGLTFRMPGISIRVAQECSGYNSSFALFIVGNLAGYLFLKSLWKRAALALAVIPLAILRNGFRIATLSALCVYDDPKWIHSPLHHRGGPIFFALSLIPFLMLLWWLRRSEVKKAVTPTQ